jgi:4,5-DOPA dioxygenase extradiol
MDRRSLLRLLGAAGSSAGLAACARSVTPSAAASGAMPVIFLAHGSPLLLDDRGWVAELAAWAQALPRPRAVLMLSAHWLDRPVTLGATKTVPLYYDFSGFPPEYYRTAYPAPGAPGLATRVRQLLGPGNVADQPERGLDHGAYVPLAAMYPRADVPVLQASLPTLDPAALLALGGALAPLRREGVLIVGSGFLTHNLRAMDMRPDAAPPGWASDFDAWAGAALARRDVDALLDYRAKAPGVQQALPTHEHFVPVIVALGASLDGSGAARVRFPITGFAYGSAARRSVQFG